MGLGFGEVVLIILILLVVFGGAKLPQIGDALGRAIKNFKRGTTENEKIAVTARSEREVKSELPKPAKTDVEDARLEEKPKA